MASRIARAAKKITIAIALAALAMAAIWYAWKIRSFKSLSLGAAGYWLDVSEMALLIATVVLVAGLVGEWPEAKWWKESFLYNVAKFAVIAGVAGELIGDAGIFEASARLQSIIEQSATARPWTKEQYDAIQRFRGQVPNVRATMISDSIDTIHT